MFFNILECRRFKIAAAYSAKRRVDHYELDFYVGGNRTVCVDGRESEVHGGCVCFRRPGQYASGVGDYDCYVSTLDFSQSQKRDYYDRHVPETPEPLFSHILTDGIPDVFEPYHKNEIFSAFGYLANCRDFSSVAAVAAMTEILMLINADLNHAKLEMQKKQDSPADVILRFINDNYKENVRLDKLAELVNLDKSYVIRLFRSKFGMSPIEYLIDYRLTQARAMLINTEMSVGEVAFECGYCSSSFFIAQYKRKFLCTPKETREIMQKQI